MSQRSARLVGGIYQVGQVVTSGGMLTTYTAYNRNTNDVVGLYVIEYPPVFDVQMVEQLLQPLEVRRSITSANVIRVYDWGIDGNRIYIATDPPRGITLRHVLDNENVDLYRTLELVRQMLQGLKVLHEHSVAGVDLRPELITVDTAAVTDRLQLDDIGLRSLLQALGYVNGQRPDDIGFLDPRYEPPEYITGGSVGPWSDIYQVGLLLFEMVTGRLPFVGRNSAETGVLQNSGPIPRMAQYKHDTPTAIQELIDVALAKNSAMRFANAQAMLNALESIQLPRRSPSGEWPGEGASSALPGSRPTGPGVGSTGEMPSMEKDIAQMATIIGGVPSAPLSSSKAGLPSAEAADVYAYLIYEKDGEEVQRFAISKKDVIVGRHDPKRNVVPDIDLTSTDSKMTVSRQHARIRYEETFFYIEDLKSRNKTRLGELTLIPLKPELLQHGDTIQFGSVRLVFKVPGLPDRPMLKESRDV